MSWGTTLKSSVGKKPMMAISGIVFCIFLLTHLAGNLTILYGKEYFNSYAKHLHSLGPLITLAELSLASLLFLHIFIGSILFIENKKARPKKYAYKKKAGGQTIGSTTMPYTGIIIFVFIIIHLYNFHFVDKTNTSIFNIVQETFSNISYICFYVTSTIAAAIHISHGFWSSFQTIGINYEKYTILIKSTGIILSLVISIGFGFMPIFVLFCK